MERMRARVVDSGPVLCMFNTWLSYDRDFVFE